MKTTTAVWGWIGALGALFLFLFFVPSAFSDSTLTSVNVILAQCSDTLDNDGDLLVDYPADPDCSSAVDDDESTPPPVFQCGDSLDNDGDLFIDYPADTGCSSASDDNETDEVVVIVSPGTGYVVSPPPPGTTSSIPTATSSIPAASSTESTTTVFLPTLPQDSNAVAALRLTDLNKDLKTNITDLSILLYHISNPTRDIAPYDLNKDEKLDIVDISILLFYWA